MKTQMHEDESTENDRAVQDNSSNVCPERAEVPEINTYPAKNLVILEGAQTNEQAFSSRGQEVKSDRSGSESE